MSEEQDRPAQEYQDAYGQHGVPWRHEPQPFPAGQQWTQGPPPSEAGQPPRKQMSGRKRGALLAIGIGFVFVAGIGGIVGSLAGSPGKAPAPAASRTHHAVPVTVPTPKPKPTGLQSESVGEGFTVSNSKGKYSVTLTKVVRHAQGSDEFEQPDSGKYFVAAVFKVHGINGYESDDANNIALLVGNNGQTYSADFSTVSGYTNFNSGDYSVSAGQTQVGAVVFQVPEGVKVSQIQWQPNYFGEGPPAIWKTGKGDCGPVVSFPVNP